MYDDLVLRLRKIVKAHKEMYGGSTEESITVEQAIDAIEVLSRLPRCNYWHKDDETGEIQRECEV